MKRTELPEFDRDSPMPPGPYRVGWTKDLDAKGKIIALGLPYTVQCGDGRGICCHVPSLPIAHAVVAALNAIYPPKPRRS